MRDPVRDRFGQSAGLTIAATTAINPARAAMSCTTATPGSAYGRLVDGFADADPNSTVLVRSASADLAHVGVTRVDRESSGSRQPR